VSARYTTVAASKQPRLTAQAGEAKDKDYR